MPLTKKSSTKLSGPDYHETISFPVKLISTPPWNNLLTDKNVVDLSQNLKLKITNEITECQNLWQQFSPDESIFDLWEIRVAFYNGYKFNPYFLSFYKDQEIIGLLPLWFNSNPTFGKLVSDFEKYTWFGGGWPEDNLFFVKNEDIIPLMLLAAPKPLELACVQPLPKYDFLESLTGWSLEEDKKYFLDLSNVKTIDDFLAHLKKKKRYNLKRDKRRILEHSPKIIIDSGSNLEKMFELSIERFKTKYPDDPSEQSAFEDPRRKVVFRDLVSNADKYQARLITTIINAKVEAVEFGLVYKKTYYAFNAGVDVSHFSGLGVFSNLLVIEDALNLGCTKIDFLESDNNWKASWQLSSFYQYSFKK